jgi:hypothetical protein
MAADEKNNAHPMVLWMRSFGHAFSRFHIFIYPGERRLGHHSGFYPAISAGNTVGNQRRHFSGYCGKPLYRLYCGMYGVPVFHIDGHLSDILLSEYVFV